MTFILGWCDDDGAFVCADSAVTHNREPLGETSSFGEAQQLDDVTLETVEERAFKILELPQGVIVAVCGEMLPALDFVVSVRKRLFYTEKPLRRILTEVSSVTSHRGRFQLLFGHRIDGIPVLTVFDIANANARDAGREGFAVFGSLPREKVALAEQLVATVRRHGLSANARLAGSLVALQSMGITEYLAPYGVGGAFFGAYVGREGVVWQQDIDYFTYTPNAFANAPSLTLSTDPVGIIRVLVREGAGLLRSSLGSPPVRLLVPPIPDRSEPAWKERALAVPPAPGTIVPSCHVGLLSVCYSKAVYMYNPGLRDDPLVVGDGLGLVDTDVEPRLVETIARKVPRDSFDLTIVTEDENGARGKTYRIDLPVESL